MDLKLKSDWCFGKKIAKKPILQQKYQTRAKHSVLLNPCLSPVIMLCVRLINLFASLVYKNCSVSLPEFYHEAMQKVQSLYHRFLFQITYLQWRILCSSWEKRIENPPLFVLRKLVKTITIFVGHRASLIKTSCKHNIFRTIDISLTIPYSAFFKRENRLSLLHFFVISIFCKRLYSFDPSSITLTLLPFSLTLHQMYISKRFKNDPYLQ